MMNKPLKGLRDYGRLVAGEGIVLLENKNNLLPLVNKKVALFGRIQTDYYKSGTGSGGLVNVTDVPSILDAMLENPRIDLNEQVAKKYHEWLSANPFNAGNGMWASEPWSQTEMAISVSDIQKLKRSDEVAVMVIGRTAGEDRDNFNGEGSYLLNKTEYEVIKNLKVVYKEVIVILNVGNVIDLNFVKELNVDGLLLVWNGGQDGARAAIDVLTGYVNPSGKLPTTIVKDLNKYPASETFGNDQRVEYLEDIYVGYRFFETFLKDEVIYPFGYGLSYTTFSLELKDADIVDNYINLKVDVTNIGLNSGKEVIQVYFEAPQGLLGKPKRQLIAFSKTKLLKPNESVTLEISFNINNMASYDDSGKIKKSAYLLEAGNYDIYFGNSVREIKKAITYSIEENIIVEQLKEALAPYHSFKRIKHEVLNNESIIKYEDTPKREIDLMKRIADNIPKDIKTNNKDFKLIDVFNNKITLDEFIGSLSEEELKMIVIGEGMSSPKVTSGTASAFGGVTDELLEKGIPILCSADGPSGIRMDSGQIATSLPNGTLLAATFNQELVTKLYELEGSEMINYNIDVLLGPGMNIQRHPLNGRNFEYFSEDPLLTGIIASAVVKGLNNVGVFGAMKHFAANNQEKARNTANSVISERALREIYLKPFEIAVKTVKASVIMTSYNPINGIWGASNYDLNTQILRKEWGFEGIVMTDWWAMMNNDQDEANRENIAAMVKAGNDLYMVAPNALEFKNNLTEKFNSGYVKLSELQRSAKNILNFVLKSLTFKNEFKVNNYVPKEINNYFNTNEEKLIVNKDNIVTTFEEQFNQKDLKEYDLVEQKGNITYTLKDGLVNVYGIKPKVVKNEFDEILKNINTKNVNLPTINWDKVILNLDEAVINNTKNMSWQNINKDAIYTYPIKVDSFGKYIVELEISSDEAKIHQMPFSVYIDNVNKKTITTNGTAGNKVKVNAHIIIDTNNKFVSFKFHKTGINVYNITIIKHG